MRLGRADDCDIRVASPGVSRLHALIFQRQGQYVLVDQGSVNGIYVGGARVKEAVLHQGDRVRIPDPVGDAIVLTFEAPVPPGALAVAASGPLGFDLDPARPRFTIGRDPGSDLVIDQPLVSRRHARFEREGLQLTLYDLGSTNGTYVNGNCIPGHAQIAPGDEIRIGPASFIFDGRRLVPSTQQQGVRLDALNLVRRVGTNHSDVILNNVSLSILPREFVALIGGSGAGKTTLMYALSGAHPAQQGTMLYNGQDFYRQPGPYSGAIGYVPQDDILHRDLPVERALEFAAELRLPHDTTRAERERRVTDVLRDVEMEAHRYKRICELSGGQRKRVSIALELLANPKVLFLDEPTSGLDPGLDKAIMTQLQLLSDRGRTVVLVTHATENIQMCDLVAIMAGGRLVYYGPPADAPAFFGVGTYPDAYRYCAQHASSIAAIEAAFSQSKYFRMYVEDRLKQRRPGPVHAAGALPGRASQKRAGGLRQWKILGRRYSEILLRDRLNLALLLGQAPVIGVLLLLVADGDSFTLDNVGSSQQILLMLTLAAIWFGTINAAREIVKERPIYQRERMVNLRLWPYILSKFGILAVLSLVQSLVLLALVALKASHILDTSILLPAFPEIWLTLLLTSMAGLASGLLISSLVTSADRAMSLIPVVLLAQAIFCGGIFALHGAITCVSYLFFSRWCLAALGSTVHMNDLVRAPLPDWPKEMYASPDSIHLIAYWLVLTGFIVVFLMGTRVSLRRQDARG